MIRLAGVVILYNPDVSVTDNIRTYLEQVGKLYVIDNSQVDNRVLLLEIQDSKKIQYIFNGKNIGVAQALNLAAERALADGFQWLLTMDQDSSFAGKDAEYFTERMSHLDPQQDVALAGVSHEISATENAYPDWRNVTTVITSGSVLRLATWQKVGGFENKLFIDEVDHEYCYRLQANGFTVIQFIGIILNHRLGRQVDAGYISFASKRKRTIHSPERCYYIVRNYLYVRRKYKQQFPKEFRKRDKEVVVRMKNNLFFGGRFLKTLKFIVRGIIDFRKNNFSLTL